MNPASWRVAACACLVVFCLARESRCQGTFAAGAEAATNAEQLARRAMATIRAARVRAGTPAGERPGTADLDPDRAALLGVEHSPLMTTLGSLDSKRLATDPRWARALVVQLASHGVGPGSIVLASFSGSFPGLNLAVMAACRAMQVRLLAISSVTASTWGAVEPGFTWPEMEVLLVHAGVLPAATMAVSVGGSSDVGRDLSEEGRVVARRIQQDTAAALRARALDAGNLADAVAQRMAAYRAALGGQRPAVYVNVGGNHASLGGASASWRHEEGWITVRPPSVPDTRSVMAHWLAEDIPVLNLLDVKALARAWDLE